MSVRAYEWQNPFGVVHTKGFEIIGFEEKPVSRSHINAGVYVLEPHALSGIVAGGYCDMPSLFEFLQAKGKSTIAYPMHEPWLDVGRPDDLRQANLHNQI
jgi:NDP-sugar pyrophosphorylase family protein